jgi:hypothetical protein
VERSKPVDRPVIDKFLNHNNGRIFRKSERDRTAQAKENLGQTKPSGSLPWTCWPSLVKQMQKAEPAV